MLNKFQIITIFSLLNICLLGIILTPSISANTPQPITQILTDSGYLYPDKDGTIDLRSTQTDTLTSGSLSSTSSPTSITSYNQMDFNKIDTNVNYIDLHFSTGVSNLDELKDSEPFDGTISQVIITPKANEYPTPLKFELLINGETTNDIITIPPLSLSPIYTTINQPFHKGDSLVWHTLDTVPNTLKIEAYTVINYNNP